MTVFAVIDDVINHVILRQNFFGPILDSESPYSKVCKIVEIILVRFNKLQL